jgi:hypothetical protein
MGYLARRNMRKVFRENHSKATGKVGTTTDLRQPVFLETKPYSADDCEIR